MEKELLKLTITIFLLSFSVRTTNIMLLTTLPLLGIYVLKFPIALIGLLNSEFSLASFISSFFVNSTLSSRQRKKAFKISSVSYAISLSLFYFSNKITIWLFVAISGLCMGIIWPNLIIFVSSFKDQAVREKLLSIYSSFLSLALVISPFLESLILLKYGLRITFPIFSLIAALIPLLPFEFSVSKDLSVYVKGKSVLRSTPFLMSIFNNLLYDIPFGVITLLGGIYAISEFKSSYSLAELVYTFFFLPSLISRIFLAYFIKPNLNVIRIVVLNFMLTLIGLILVFESGNLLIYVIALVILGIPHGLTYSSSLIILSRNYKGEDLSRANSYFSGVFMGLGSVGPFFLSSTVQLIGIKDFFILIIFGVILLFLIILLLYWNRR